MSEAAERQRVILHADDFGLSEAASASIVVRAGLRGISAASCVVDGASAVRYACELRELSRLSSGLHLREWRTSRSEFNVRPVPFSA
jgi:predicted glycoside hydrolase/deacetylase ChbG (UPF0249 family)